MREFNTDSENGSKADTHPFFRMSKALFFDEHYKDLSIHAKVLYSLFLDRLGVSRKNQWLDQQSRVFIIYSIEAIEEDMNCSHQKAIRLVNELVEYDLIERKRQGQGKPNLIYVKDLFEEAGETVEEKNADQEVQKSSDRKYGKHISESMKNSIPEVRKSYANKTENNKTEESKIYPILSEKVMEEFENQEVRKTYHLSKAPEERRVPEESYVPEESHVLEERKDLEYYFRKEAGLDALLQENPCSRKIIQGILELLVDTCTSQRKTIMIAGEARPTKIVKSRFMKLDIESLRYVLSCLENNTTEIKNVRQYLLTTLYNAPVTIGAYYQAKVNSDMAKYATA